MQVAVRTTVWFLLLYLAVLVGIALWLERDYQKTAREVMTDAAELITRQISAALHEPTLDRLLKRDVESDRTLEEIIDSAIARSDMIGSILVVDSEGLVVAGGDVDDKFLDAKAIFGDDLSLQVISQFEPRFSAGKHVAYAPIQAEGKLRGYFRIILSNHRINTLRERLVRRFSTISFIGLVSILILGGLLHIQLSRVGRDIVELMSRSTKEQIEIDTLPKDEFRAVRTHASELGGRVRRTLSELDTLSQALRVGMIQFDEDNNPLFISQGARDLLGTGDGADIRQALDDAWPVFEKAVTDLREQDTSITTVDLDIAQNGGKKTIQFEFLFPDKYHSGPYVVLLRDRDTLDALDADLRAATRLHTLSSIYLGAAHDMRAPINAIMMNLELLDESVSGRATDINPEDRIRYVGILKDELNRLQRFLQSFLEHTAPVKRVGREEVELTTALEDIVRLLSTQARHSQIEINTCLPDHSVWLHASTDEIRQALLNVIINAFEAMQNGGTLDITVELRGKKTRIEIKDDGPGVPSSLIDRIFDMHFTTKDTGSGIGLYVARSVIEKHGGTLAVESELGEGTNVIIELPAHDSPTQTA